MQKAPAATNRGCRGCVASKAGSSLQRRRTEPVKVLQRRGEPLAGGEDCADTARDPPADSSSRSARRRRPRGAGDACRAPDDEATVRRAARLGRAVPHQRPRLRPRRRDGAVGSPGLRAPRLLVRDVSIPRSLISFSTSFRAPGSDVARFSLSTCAMTSSSLDDASLRSRSGATLGAMVERDLARLATSVSRRRRAVFAVWVALLAAGGWFSLHQSDHLSGGGWEVPGSPSVRVTDAIQRDFPNLHTPVFTVFVTGRTPAAVTARCGRRAASPRPTPVSSRDAPCVLDGGRAALLHAQLPRALVERDRRGDAPPSRARPHDAHGADARHRRARDLVELPGRVEEAARTRRGDRLPAHPPDPARRLRDARRRGRAARPRVRGGVPHRRRHLRAVALVRDLGLRHEHGVDDRHRRRGRLLALHRQPLPPRAPRGADKAQALARAMSSSGTAVVFSGATVAVSLAALFAIDVNALRSMAVGAIVVVCISVLASITLLPAMLAARRARASTGLRLPLRGGRARPAATPSGTAGRGASCAVPSRASRSARASCSCSRFRSSGCRLQPRARRAAEDAEVRVATERAQALTGPGFGAPVHVLDRSAGRRSRATLAGDPGRRARRAAGPRARERQAVR